MHEAGNIDFKEFALAAGEELRSVVYPRLGNISAGHLYTFVPRPPKLEPPEFVYVPGPYKQLLGDNYSTKALLTITIDTCIINVLYSDPEGIDETIRKRRVPGKATPAGHGVLGSRTPARGDSTQGWG